VYWQTGDEDAAMQAEHGFMWRALLDTVDVDVRGKRALDAGCNQGGFLRLLCDEGGIASGYGYDLFSGAIADALLLSDPRPLTFEVGESVPAGWNAFDVAFSHEVLYLLEDLTPHAAAIHDALAPGGVYYAVMGVHADAPTMVDWHARNAERLHLPPLHALDDVIASFTEVGFEAAVARLNVRFIPASSHATSFPAGLDYFYDHKVVLRFARDNAAAAS
jgi:SAM-dependent methyltransferase